LTEFGFGGLQQSIQFALQRGDKAFASFMFGFFFRRPTRESHLPKRFYLLFVQCGYFSGQFRSDHDQRTIENGSPG
jgi:hypothetical protein